MKESYEYEFAYKHFVLSIPFTTINIPSDIEVIFKIHLHHNNSNFVFLKFQFPSLKFFKHICHTEFIVWTNFPLFS